MRSLSHHIQHNYRQTHRALCRGLQTNVSNNIQVVNPYNDETYCEVEKADYNTAQSMLANASETQKQWWSTTGATIGLIERQHICTQFLDAFNKYSDSIARDISCMMGKPLQQSYNEIAAMRERATALIDISTQFLSDMPVPPQMGFDRKIRKEPIGTVLIVAPWNYPLLCTINSLIPAILSGNSVLLKLSSKTPLVANHFAAAFQDVGCPPSLVQALHCDHDTTTQIIQDPRISSVVFTGSVSGGYQIQKATANRLINATLELGGKDPAYIASDADLEHAVASVVDGAMYNAGQSCCAIERVYVHKSLYDDFVELASELVSQQYVIGDPLYEHPRDVDKRKGMDVNKEYDANLAPTTNMGPLAQKSSVEFLSTQVKDAVDKGAKLVIGDSEGYEERFFKPTIIKDCDHTMSVMKEESFGPILPIQCVEDDKEAIELMNDSEYGLTAAVFTKDKRKMDRLFGPQIETGTVFMNRCDYLDPYLAWSGVKQTGKGVSLSPFCFDNFTKLKSLHFKLKT